MEKSMRQRQTHRRTNKPSIAPQKQGTVVEKFDKYTYASSRWPIVHDFVVGY